MNYYELKEKHKGKLLFESTYSSELLRTSEIEDLYSQDTLTGSEYVEDPVLDEITIGDDRYNILRYEYLFSES